MSVMAVLLCWEWNQQLGAQRLDVHNPCGPSVNYHMGDLIFCLAPSVTPGVSLLCPLLISLAGQNWEAGQASSLDRRQMLPLGACSSDTA